jgi:hypothetical protein
LTRSSRAIRSSNPSAQRDRSRHKHRPIAVANLTDRRLVANVD